MMEFLIGMVAILVLLAGLVQLVSLTQSRAEAMNGARRRAGLLAMGGDTASTTPDFIRFWNTGDDEKAYSADDEYGWASANHFEQAIIEPTAAESHDWTVLS